MRPPHKGMPHQAADNYGNRGAPMTFTHECTRIVNGKKCRLTGYLCEVKVKRGEPHIITAAKELCCFWFTRDPEEGKREFDRIRDAP